MSAVVAAASIVVAGCADEPQVAGNPLCDVAPLDASVLAIDGVPTPQQFAALEDYVARIEAADPSLRAQTEKATAAITEAKALAASSTGDVQSLGPEGKPVFSDTAAALRRLSDAVAAATESGCPQP